MKTKGQVLLSLVLSVPLLLAAAPAFAEPKCDLIQSTEGMPFTYPDFEPSPPTMGHRLTRGFEYRVGAVISPEDAHRVLEAANLGHLNPVLNPAGKATLWLHAVLDQVTEYLPGDVCEGLVVGPSNVFFAYLYTSNPAVGRTELVFPVRLSTAEAGPSGLETGARIDMQMMQEGGRQTWKTSVESVDGELQVEIEATFPTDADYVLNNPDLWVANVPFWMATSPVKYGDDPLWEAFHRMQYTMQPGDEVHIDTGNPDLLCLNQLGKTTAHDLCVTVLGAQPGVVYRRNEAYGGQGLE